MEILGLDHIVLCVRDVSETIRFYDDVLGMEPREDRPGKWSMHSGVFKISLQDIRNVSPLARDTIPGTGNFCLLTSTPIHKVADELQTKGIDIVEGPTKRSGAAGGLMSIYFNDPDGNLVEVGNRL